MNNMMNNNAMNMNNNNAMNVGNKPQFDANNNYGCFQNNNNNFVNSNYNNNINSNNQSPNNYISDSNKIDESRLNNNNLFTKDKFSKILKESTEFKLSDFGLSKAKSEIKKRNLAGSPLYMSPELFKLDSKLSEIENKKVDIWALGVLTYELFFGKRPFEAFSIDELSRMYEQGTYVINLRVEDKKNQKISKELFFFINRCLQKDPQKRANVYELRNGDFLNYDVISSEKMGETELEEYLNGIAKKEDSGNFILNINKDYAEEIKIRELNKMWINNN
jgi:serine/threonine protein kinase